MKRLDWLLFRSLIPPFIMSFVVIMFILVLQFMALYMDEILGKGLGPGIIFKLFFYASGRISITAFPLALLTAALMTFGSMGEHYELASIKSCGINLFRIMRAPILLSLILTWISFWFSFDIAPKSNLKFYSLLYDVQRKKPDVAIKPGHFYSDIDGYIIRVSDKDVSTGTLYDVMIYDHSAGRLNVDVILADSGKTSLENQGSVLRMVLFSGARHQEYKPDPGKTDTYRHGRTYFDSLIYKFSLSGFELDRTDEDQFRRHQITASRGELADAIDSLELLLQKNFVKNYKQLGRYTQVDTNFMEPGVYTWYPSVGKKKVKKGLDSIRRPGVYHTAGTAIASKIAKEKKSASTGSGADSTGYMGKTTLKEEEAPIARIDTIPLVPALLNGEDLMECFHEMNTPEILNRALVGARAVKSYTEYMQRKKKDEGRLIRKYYFEFYSRHSLPITCFLFMLIGASLGAIIRKGGLGYPALGAVVLFVAYYVLTTQGKKLSREGVLEPFWGALLPIFVFTPLALVLTYQATMDSKVLDMSAWRSIPKILWNEIRLFMRWFNKS